MLRSKLAFVIVGALVASIISVPSAKATPPITRTLPEGSALYSVSCEGTNGQLAEVNPSTGAQRRIGTGTTDANSGYCAGGATYNTQTSTAYYYVWLSDRTNLFSIDLTGHSTFIGELSPGRNLYGADAGGHLAGGDYQVRGISADAVGKLYTFWKGNNGNYYIGLVNPSTADISEVVLVDTNFKIAFDGEEPYSLAFNPVDQKFYTAGYLNSPNLYSINVTTGQVEDKGETGNPSDAQLIGTAIDSNGVMWGAHGDYGPFLSATVAGWIQSDDLQLSYALTPYNSWALFIAPEPAAGPGDLDISFGDDGKVTTEIGSTDDAVTSVAVQSDGKIVAAGYTDIGSGFYGFLVARYKSDGILDETFSTDGYVTTAIGTTSDAYSIALHNEKIIVAGTAIINSQSVFAVARYNSDGTLDETFSTDGYVTTAIGTTLDGINSVAVQSDGKIVAAGYSYVESASKFAIARYKSDGTLDETFSTDGYVTTAIGTTNDVINSVAVQSDGKIVAAGYSNVGSASKFAIARYNSSGALDETFGYGGKVTTTFYGFDETVNSIAIQSDGKIIAAGYANTNSEEEDYDLVLARYIGSESTATAPSAPTLNSVTPGDRRVIVSFTAGADNGAAITDYEYSLNGGSYVSAGTTTSPITITGLNGRTSYSVIIKARNSAGLSSASSSLSATTTDASLDSGEVAARVAAEATRLAAEAAAAQRAKEQKELPEILSVIPYIAGLALNLGDLTNSLIAPKKSSSAKQKCVKGTKTKFVKKGAKCPKAYSKKK